MACHSLRLVVPVTTGDNLIEEREEAEGFEQMAIPEIIFCA